LTLSGAGIDLQNDNPSVEMMREAVNALLEKEDYRLNAAKLAKELASYDSQSLICELLETLVEARIPDAMPA
jgi:UDP:flavonoid glycosyltransferase YjiC (YdhE family)